MLSDGQAWAVKQLQDVARASDYRFEIVEIKQPSEIGQNAEAIVSIDCRHLPKADGGVPLKVRETFRISVPSAFPLSRPSVNFTHTRYGDFPHIQWGSYICLYQAPDIEWQPSQGMYGLLDRLNAWLAAAGMNQLAPVGVPLHPPTVYAKTSYAVIPCIDAPSITSSFWCGYVEIKRDSEVLAELGRWIVFGEKTDGVRVATALLLPGSMPHEYPTSVFDLINALMARGLPLEILKSAVLIGALSTGLGQPALMVLGAAMRGIAGGERFQHLACWRIPAEFADKIREEALRDSGKDETTDEAFYEWAATAKIEWCRVYENRPEVVERRDSASASQHWRGKHVAVLGCGAIGGAVALFLARAGVKRLQLYDTAVVKPGILVRQNFPHRHINYLKSSSLKLSVKDVDPDIDVMDSASDVTSVLRDKDGLKLLMAADVIIDATASNVVATAFELMFRHQTNDHPPLVSMCIGHNADMALMTLAEPSVMGMAVDIDRRSKLYLSEAPHGRVIREEFWPTALDRRMLFQPEPGCSSPTFRGSFADVMALVAPMFNKAAQWLSERAEEPRHRLYALDLSTNSGASRRELTNDFEPAVKLSDGRGGFEVRFSRRALTSMITWMRRSERVHGTRIETGGIVFGAVDDLLKVVWIDELSGPPADSMATAAGFVCGTAGVADLDEEIRLRSGGSTSFVGMWHTHPLGLPIPSSTDLAAMRGLLAGESAYVGRRFLMLIAGGTSQQPILSASVFDRSDYGD